MRVHKINGLGDILKVYFPETARTKEKDLTALQKIKNRLKSEFKYKVEEERGNRSAYGSDRWLIFLFLLLMFGGIDDWVDH